MGQFLESALLQISPGILIGCPLPRGVPAHELSEESVGLPLAHSSRLHALCSYRMRRRQRAGGIPEGCQRGTSQGKECESKHRHGHPARSMIGSSVDGWLILEALRFLPQTRVAETVRRWLPYQNGSPDDRDERGATWLSQTTELARVKARIKALAEKTVANGCTEAEAMSAAEMVGRLLERYALGMDEIEVRATRCVQVEVPIGGRRRRPIDGCVPAIARFCDCKVWLARPEAPPDGGDADTFDWPRPGSRYVFFGFRDRHVVGGLPLPGDRPGHPY